MKIFAFSIVLLLIVSLQQTEAVGPFFRVFRQLGYKQPRTQAIFSYSRLQVG
jgi:hypothetical protein